MQNQTKGWMCGRIPAGMSEALGPIPITTEALHPQKQNPKENKTKIELKRWLHR